MTKTVQSIENVCRAIPFTDVKIDSLFWNPVLETHHKVTVHTVVERCFETNRVENFIKSGKYLKIGMDQPLPKELAFEGRFYDDSDVYKAIEGAAYSLMQYPDDALEAKIDIIIDAIEGAQWADGYLNTFYTIDTEKKGQRWMDMDRHEMYCGGHLIEAAIAYYYATGKEKLLKVSKKMTEHWLETFGSDKRHWVEGHQEVELALVKFYELTKDRRYLDFALWLLSERGKDHYESEGRPYLDKDQLFFKREYHQDHLPVEEQSFVCGHAVRAMYMYTGMADVAKYFHKEDYMKALTKIWENIVYRNMYVTGGIGSSKENEGFTEDFDLPNSSAYAETCAAIGMVFFNHRMNLLHEDGKYADIIEREIYNGVLSGVSLSGDKFFYVNPLESNGKSFEEGGHRRRQEWFKTSCCPTNVSRFLPCASEYIYAQSNEKIYINQYISSRGNIDMNGNNLHISQETKYPWDGEVEVKLKSDDPIHATICFRIPDWCNEYSYQYSGNVNSGIEVKNGYVCIDTDIHGEETLKINLVMKVKKVRMDPRVKEDLGKVALQRGPVVYAFEEVDNPNGIDDILIGRDTQFFSQWSPDLLKGIVKLKVKNEEKEWYAIPYYAWDNRELGKMTVFVKELIDNARSVENKPS
ncbi:MAG TPA: beta-L-arabinofuranosidase domain-containing protein [Pseudoneobacillus sp.]|nr:beta-L-arabinofuranosidase domain-containing protein [Pseudoneobacillus sp.]